MGSIYHYCSNDTFHKIISTDTLRLSSMSLSNDSEEGIFTIKVLELAYRNAKEKQKPKGLSAATGGLFALGARYLTYIYPELDSIRKSNDGLGLCMSSEGDMLSQWRGYADDGHGISIGFSREAMLDWTNTISSSDYPVDLIEVIYAEKVAEQKLQPLVNAISKHVDDGALTPPDGLFGLLELPTDPKVIERKERIARAKRAFDDLIAPAVVRELYRYKHPAFSEEKEWRVLTTFQPEKAPSMFEVHPTRSILKPYVSLSIEDEKKSLISEIIIGPKNATPNAVIEAFLNTNGYVNVHVRRSRSTYR